MIGKKEAKSQVLLACLLIVMSGSYLVAAAPSTIKRQGDGPADALSRGGGRVNTLYTPYNTTRDRDGFWTISLLNDTAARFTGQWNRLDAVTCPLDVYIKVPRALVPRAGPAGSAKTGPTPIPSNGPLAAATTLPAADGTTGLASGGPPDRDAYTTTYLTQIPAGPSPGATAPFEFTFNITNNLRPLFRASNLPLYIVFKEACRGGREFTFRLIQIVVGETA